jgi:hypothetical protein
MSKHSARGRRPADRVAAASVESIANQIASAAFAEAFNGVVAAAGRRHPTATIHQVVEAFHSAMRSRLEWLEISWAEQHQVRKGVRS